MMLTSAASVDLIDISMLNAGIVALLGYAVVFFGLILLMLVVMAMGRFFVAQEKKKTARSAAQSDAVDAQMAAVPVAPHTKGAIVLDNGPKAPGSAGSLKLHDVDPKTAAMVMAIVANKMGRPLNELRFTSIKEVK